MSTTKKKKASSPLKSYHITVACDLPGKDRCITFGGDGIHVQLNPDLELKLRERCEPGMNFGRFVFDEVSKTVDTFGMLTPKGLERLDAFEPLWRMQTLRIEQVPRLAEGLRVVRGEKGEYTVEVNGKTYRKLWQEAAKRNLPSAAHVCMEIIKERLSK